MLDFIQSVVPILVTIFVIFTMLNTGLTQTLGHILSSLRNGSFVLKMLAANFIGAPLVMIIALNFFSFDPAYEAGLLILSMCAGAPFLVKMTEKAGQDVALGAAVMVFLMVVTIFYTPVVLPLVLSGIEVDAWAVAQSLIVQMLVPISVGMLMMKFLPNFGQPIQPWVGKIGTWAVRAVVVFTVIGYFPDMLDLFGTGAILMGVVFIAIAFGLGTLAGWGEDRLEIVGALGTAQRNVAAVLIIATQNFTDPNVLIIVTVVNILGIIALMSVAGAIDRQNPLRELKEEVS